MRKTSNGFLGFKGLFNDNDTQILGLLTVPNRNFCYNSCDNS